MLPAFLAIQFGPVEWAIALGLIILLFGAAKIPELARSLGKAKGEYHKAVKEGEREVEDEEKSSKTENAQ